MFSKPLIEILKNKKSLRQMPVQIPNKRSPNRTPFFGNKSVGINKIEIETITR